MSVHNVNTQNSTTSRLGLDKKNILLLGVLLLQLVLAVVIYWQPEASVADSAPLLTLGDVDEIIGLRIQDGNGNLLELERRTGSWSAAGTDGYPADEEKTASVLNSLLAINRLRMVTETDASHKRLQVAQDEFVSQITLETAQDESIVYVGSSAGPGSTHVRLAGEERTYLTSEIASWELQPQLSAWIDTSYMSIPTDEVTTVTIDNDSETLTFIKDDNGAWTLADLHTDESVDESAINSLIGLLTTVNLLQPMGLTLEPAYGLDNPLATAEISFTPESGQSETVTLQLGAPQDDDASYYAKATTSDHYVTIAKSLGDELINAARSEFLAEPQANEQNSGTESSPEQPEIDSSQSITP